MLEPASVSFLFRVEYYSTGAKLFFRPHTYTVTRTSKRSWPQIHLKMLPLSRWKKGPPGTWGDTRAHRQPSSDGPEGSWGLRGTPISPGLTKTETQPRLSSQAPVPSRGGARTGQEGGQRGDPQPGVPSVWPPERLLCQPLLSQNSDSATECHPDALLAAPYGDRNRRQLLK